MAIIRSIQGFNMPKPWSSTEFMKEVRAKVPAFSKKQVKIKLNGYGTSRLSTVEGVSLPATGVFEFDPNNQYRISASNVDFMVTPHHDEGMKGQYPFIIKPTLRSLYIGLSKDSTKVIGRSSEDSRVFRSAFNELFPEFAFAITFLGANKFELNALEANPSTLNIKVGAIKLDDNTMNEIIMQNAIKIRKLLDSPTDLKNLLFGRYLYAVADPKGQLVSFLPKGAIKTTGVTGLGVKYHWIDGAKTNFEGYEELEPIYLEGKPAFITTIFEGSAKKAESINVSSEIRKAKLNGSLKIIRE